jgi:uncharacterized protein YraI
MRMRRWLAALVLALTLAVPAAAAAGTPVRPSAAGSRSGPVQPYPAGTLAKLTHDGVQAGGGMF